MSDTGAVGILRRIERQIRRLYALEQGRGVEDYLIGEKIGPFASEETVVVSSPEGVEVGVYIDPELLRFLAQCDPWVTLDSSNLFPFCRVLEEISHFTYLQWNAGHDKPVTALEMELQAEVDKFVLSALYLSVQNDGRVPVRLAETVLYAARFDPSLESHLLSRYLTAQRLASRYCAHLQRCFLRAGRFHDLLAEIRRFYRMSHYGKIDHIHGRVPEAA